VNSSSSQGKVARPLAAIYVRQSRTDEDAGARNISPDVQEHMCRKLLDGYEIRVFTDLNRSGKETSKRPSYLEMLRLINEGVITKVVAYELSRITRDVGDQADFFKQLASHGVEFVLAREHIDLSSPEGEFGAVILGGSNQLQRKQTQRRVRDAFARKRERGDSIGRLLPGLVRAEGRDAQGRRTTVIEWDATHVATIREVFAEYASGSHSFRSLAREMSRRGHPLPRSADAPPREAASVQWTPEKVRGLLSNEKYTGEYTHRGHRYQIPVAGIIDAASWSACVRIRMGAHKPLRVNRKNRNYLLSGILHCERCGKSCSGFLHRDSGRKSANRTWPYYICGTHRNLGREGCAQPYFRQPELEQAVLDFLHALMIPGLAEAVDAAIASYAGQERRSSRQARGRSINERLKRLLDLYEFGDLTKAEYRNRKNDLLIERDQLEAEPAAASIALQRQRLESIVDDWSVMTDEEKKRVLQMIFSEIRADHTADGLKIEFRPKPIWEPYVEAVLARQKQEQDTLATVTTSERKTGLEPAVGTHSDASRPRRRAGFAA
jgi:site-specific DNA recombinase